MSLRSPANKLYNRLIIQIVREIPAVFVCNYYFSNASQLGPDPRLNIHLNDTLFR